MTTDTTAHQLHKTTAAALPTQWAWQMGGARLGGIGVDWDTGHVNFNLRERDERKRERREREREREGERERERGERKREREEGHCSQLADVNMNSV